MESIDRLREWANGLHGVYINRVDHTITVTTGWDAPPDMDSVSLRDHIIGILDAIESEVKANRVDAYTKGYDEGFASADDFAAQHEDAMAEHGWVRLPLDADGEVIHGGDMMVKPDSYDNRLFTVGGMTLYGDQWSVQGFAPTMLRHYAPTVEDVLREFVTKAENIGDYEVSEDALIAEYAAKLGLADGVDA